MGLTQSRQKMKRHRRSSEVFSDLERLTLIEMCVCVCPLGMQIGHGDRCFLRWIKCHQVSFSSSFPLTCLIMQTCKYFDPKNALKTLKGTAEGKILWSNDSCFLHKAIE